MLSVPPVMQCKPPVRKQRADPTIPQPTDLNALQKLVPEAKYDTAIGSTAKGYTCMQLPQSMQGQPASNEALKCAGTQVSQRTDQLITNTHGILACCGDAAVMQDNYTANCPTAWFCG